MSSSYEVTKIEKDGDYVSITITVNEDGSLRIFDHSFGPSADLFYGEDRDVEHWLDLDNTAVQKLLTALTGEVTPTAADDLARLLAKSYAGQNLALRSIMELCDEKMVEYKEGLWT